MSSVIRGSDNFDSLTHQGIGVNQTWQDVTASRAVGVTYTNSTSKPICVQVVCTYASGAQTTLPSITVDGVIVTSSTTPGSGGTQITASVIVPSGSNYIVNSNRAIFRWVELR